MSMNFFDTLIRKNTGELTVIQPRPVFLFEPEQCPGAPPVVSDETQKNRTSELLTGKPSGQERPPASYHPAKESGKTVFKNPESETASTDQAIPRGPEQNHGHSWDSSPMIHPNQLQDMAVQERRPTSDSPILNPTRNVQPPIERHEPAPPVPTNVKDPELRVIENTKTVLNAQPENRSKPMDSTPVTPQPEWLVRETKTERPRDSTGLVQPKLRNQKEAAPPGEKGYTAIRKSASPAPFYPASFRTSVYKEPWQAPMPPQVTISIGTIEIRATEKKRVRKTTEHFPAREPVLSLDDYLRQVNGDQK